MRVIARLVALLYFLSLALSWGAPALAAGGVGVNKAFNPDIVNFGTDSTLVITLINNDPTASVNVTTLLDNLPAGVSVDSSVTPTTTCAGGVVTTTASSVTLTGGVIPQAPNAFTPGTCTISVNVFGAAAQNYTNTIPIGGLQTSAGSNTTAASATLQVTNPGNIGVAINVSPNTVPETATPVYVITVTNPNSLPITNATIPGTLTAVSGGPTLHIVGPVTTTCAGGTGSFANTANPTFTVTGATIPANGSCTISVPVSLNGQFANGVRKTQLAVAAGAITSAQGVSNNTGASAIVTYDPITPTLAKSFTPSSTIPGATVTINVTAANRDTVDLTNYGFTDVLPGGLTLAATPNLVNSCGGPAGSISGTTTVVVTGLTLPAAPSLGATGTSCKISFSVVVPLVPPSQTPTNTVNGSSITNDQGLKSVVNGSATLIVGPTPTPVPTFSKGFSPSSIARANNSTLAINVINPASALPLSAVNITDTLPAGLVIAATPTANANCGSPIITGPVGGTVVTMTGGTLAAGKTCTLSVLVTATVGPPFSVVLHNDIPPGGITAIASGGGSVTNTSDVTANLTVGHGLSLNHYFSPSGANPVNGGAIKTAVSVTDRIVSTAGNDDHNLSATFNLNASGTNVKLFGGGVFSYVCTKGSVLTFTPNGTLTAYTVTSADFIFKDSCTITYSVTSTVAGTFNAGSSTISSTEDNVQTIGGTSSVEFVAPSNLNVNKMFTPNTIPAAGTSTLQITISNNASALPGGIVFNETGVQLIDNLPAGMTVANPPSASTTCLNSTGGAATLVASAGSSTITLSNAALPSRTAGGVLQPCSISVNVTSSVQGNLINTIPANSMTSDSGATNPFSASATLTSTANIALSKAFLTSPIPPGGSTWVALTFTDESSGAVTVTSVTDNLPSGIVVKDTTSQPPPQGGAPPNCGATVTGVAGGSSFTVSNFSLTGNASCVTYVAVTTPTPAQLGSFTNTIPAGAIVSPGGLTNFLPASANITVAAVSLSLSKVVRDLTTGGTNTTAGSANPGDTLLYTLTYTNTSPFPESNLVLHDTVPANTTFVSAACGTLGAGLTGCTPSGPTAGVVTWTLTGSLNPGASGTVTLTVTVQ